MRDLRSFAVAARTGNLGRAALHLNVTAAAVSQQLSKLEKTLDVQLLIRHSRGVSATKAGRELLRRIDAILGLLEAPLADEPVRTGVGGTVRVALPAELAPFLATPLFAATQRQSLSATFSLIESGDDALASLCDGEVDVALLQDPPKRDELEIIRLLAEDLGVVVAPAHALAASAMPLRLRDLLATALILPNARHWIRRLLAKAEVQRGIRFDVAAQVDGVPMILALVRCGSGAAVLPAASVGDQAATGALVFRPLVQPALAVTHAVAICRTAAPAVRHLAETMAGAVRALAAGGAWPGARLLRPPEQSGPAQPGRFVFPPEWRPTAVADTAVRAACVEGG